MNKGFDLYGCMTPWHEMYVKPNGRAKPCCASDPKKDFPLTDKLTEAFNNTHYRQMRSTMLNNQGPAECSNCYQKEELYGYSLRDFRNSKRYLDKLGIYTNYNLDAHKQKFKEFQNPRELKVLKIDFSNGCNLRCPMCNPAKSTSWFKDKIAMDAEWDFEELIQEYQPFRNIRRPLTPDLQAEYSKNIPITWIDQNWKLLKKIATIEVSGGEPFFHPQFLYLLDKLAQDNWQGTLRIISNLTLITDKHIEQLRQLKQVQINASIDSCGKLHEYLRPSVPVGKYTWSNIQDTILELKAVPNIRLNLCYVSQALNFYNTIDWFDFLLEHGFKSHGFNMLSKPQWLRINNYPDAEAKQELIAELTQPKYKQYEKSIKLLTNAFNNPVDPADWKAFCRYMNFLDKQRETSIINYIPEFERHWIYD